MAFVLPSGLRFVALVDREETAGWSLSAPMVLSESGSGPDAALGLSALLPEAALDTMFLRRDQVLCSYLPNDALARSHLDASMQCSPAIAGRLAPAAPVPTLAPPPAAPPATAPAAAGPTPAAPGPRANRAEQDVDLVVRDHFFPERGYRGLFVDVGAARPDYLSVSALYRGLGWRVLAVEPNPEFAALQRRAGAEVLEYACGTRDEDDVEFTLVNQHGQAYEGGQVSYESFSSLGIKKEYAELKKDLDTRKIRVKLRRLETILRQHAPEVERIDILSIDVEGWELEVLQGLDLPRRRPRVMVIENLFRSQAYVDALAGAGYRLWRRLYPNDVYVAPDAVDHPVARPG
jgi:FkbM family methyltransferase